MTSSSLLTTMAAAAAAAVSLAVPAVAQNVGIGGSEIKISSAAGEVVEITSGADYTAGGGGEDADVTLRDGLGNALLSYGGAAGDLILGGGDQDGDIILRDTDGTTTTINLLGEFGFIQLGSVDDDGDLRLWDNDPDDEFSIDLDGGTGNVTNQLGGNGLLKAWARIRADGTVESCFRCNPDPAKTFRENDGVYRVDFGVLGTDLLSRPMLCKSGALPFGVYLLSAQCSWTGTTTVKVATMLVGPADIELLDLPFEVFIF